MMPARRQTGLSLIELMIALTIGLVLLAGLTYVFVNSSKSQRVGQQASQQNDNARYAMDTLTTDLHQAGYYGDYGIVPDGTSATLPDPCVITPAVTDLGYPVQGYVAQETPPVTIPAAYPDLSATSCGTWLPQANLMPGSDVLVIRRVDSAPLAVGAQSVQNQLYLQTNPLGTPEFQTGNGSTMTNLTKADGTAADLTEIDPSTGTTFIAGPINQYYVDIYFVAPCSIPNGQTTGSFVCTGASDDNGNPIPTLKLLQLSLKSDGSAMTFNIITIAEGIQAMKLEYGIDNNPANTNTVTNRIGDGIPDTYEPNSLTVAPAATDFPSAVNVRVFMISRSTTPITGFTDSKTYQMSTSLGFGFSDGSTGLGLSYTYGDSFMRHNYENDIRLTNVAGRREIPGQAP